MKKKDIIFEGDIKSQLEDCFMKDGRLIPQYEEEGADTGLAISVKNADPKKIVCPYCGVTDNFLEKEKVGPPILAQNRDGGDPFEITLDGFRCASCFRKWIKLNFSKDRAFAIGIKSEIAKDQAS